jgi:hypothetical protein
MVTLPMMMRSDQQIRSAGRSALNASLDVDPVLIDLSCTGSVIVLRGEVASHAAVAARDTGTDGTKGPSPIHATRGR